MPMLTTILHTATLGDLHKDAIAAVIPGEFEVCSGHCRLYHRTQPLPEALMVLRQQLGFDINMLPPRFDVEEVGLLLTDMDSTLINIECIDEIADFAGVKPQVAAITEAAMRGELDFAASLTQRVATLDGLDEGVLQRVYDERLAPNPGAEALVAGLHRHGVKVGVVSGGFTFFTDRLKARLALDFSRANVLEQGGGKLTGRVVGAIVDAAAKARFLEELCEELRISPSQSIAMGDGANDLLMMQRAGLGIAYRAKPKVQLQADVVLNHATLAEVLHLISCRE
ncbi:MAG TPA: phosphoserine phosphatase SerB [Gammaproteobacteria bacterium]